MIRLLQLALLGTCLAVVSRLPAQPAADDSGEQQRDRPQAAKPLQIDSHLPPDTVVVSLRDATGEPVRGRVVKLIKTFSSIAEGQSKEVIEKRSDRLGQVRFDSLSAGAEYRYQTTVAQGPAVYASPVFSLRETGGHQVNLTVYEVTRNIEDGRIAMRGLVYIQPRTDVFQLEFWFQIFSVGNLTWVPNGESLTLPKGASAFLPQQSSGDLRFEQRDERHAELRGTVTPGQHDVRFSVQVPNQQRSTARFDLSLLPHTKEFRVVVESSPQMSLHVPGFPEVQVSEGPGGERVLVTQARRDQLDRVHLEVSGLPTRGSAPWVAVSLALLAAGLGLFWSPSASERWQQRERQETKLARDLLLAELVALEGQRRDGVIGPRTYEQSRRLLLEAVGRLVMHHRASRGSDR